MNLRDLVAAPVEGCANAEVPDPRRPVTRPPANPELDLIALMFGIERLDAVLGS
jgi:hypothetical protein